MRTRTYSYQGPVAAVRRLLATVPVIALAAFMAMPLPVSAEDEDSSTQVYLVFDPETGEFVKSHDPNAALPPQTGLESAVSAAADTTGGSPESGNGTTTIAVVVAALVIAVGAGVAIARSRRKPA